MNFLKTKFIWIMTNVKLNNYTISFNLNSTIRSKIISRFADQLRASFDKSNDDSASELDDSIELRCETEDEKAKEVENEESEIITASSIFIEPPTPSNQDLPRSITVEMLHETELQTPSRNILGTLCIFYSLIK